MGAGLVEGGTGMVQWGQLLSKVIIPMFSSPVAGFVAGFFVMTGLMWLVRRWPPRRVNRWFRTLQIASAAWMAFAHGRNDSQNAMGVITLALLAHGTISQFDVPLTVMVVSAAGATSCS